MILSAGMRAGHDGVAVELARRLAAEGAETEVVDVLELLPARLGPALRWWYRQMIHSMPWMYDVIYRTFFVSDRAPSTSPLTISAAARLSVLLRRRPPTEVVSTFHLAAQVAGHLREHGRLRARSTVLITDFAVHRLWLHAGNDRYLCLLPALADVVTAATGRPAFCHAPVVRPEFRRAAADLVRVRDRLGVRPNERMVLVAAGSWGVGDVEETARVLARSGRYLPVVLCGHNGTLRGRLHAAGLGTALGWRTDLPELMAAAHAMVDNAAGLTCKEAFAARLPVVVHRPIPGHGRDGARCLAQAGLSVHARNADELLDALDRLDDGAQRSHQVDRAAALFSAPSAESLLRSPAVIP